VKNTVGDESPPPGSTETVAAGAGEARASDVAVRRSARRGRVIAIANG
jgi:hypothetical protein